MIYTAKDIATIINADLHLVNETAVTEIVIDSRKIQSPEQSVYFALNGLSRDGHSFIQDAYDEGVQNFVVSQVIDYKKFPKASFLKVEDTLAALQLLTATHRKRFSIPVIGITGSNGKTIVKEWLFQLLQPEYNIVRSPRSYNSQIGVPLSVWQMNETHTLAIFEAGISRSGEMEKLEKVIQPTIGLFTNIGEAHSEGFTSQEQKLKEKEILFVNARRPASLRITAIKPEGNYSVVTAQNEDHPESTSIRIPFRDNASIQNAVTCWQLMLMMGYDDEVIKTRMALLEPVNMRLELKKAINGCYVINDSYSADLTSFEIALNFLDQQSSGSGKTVILSDFLQSAIADQELYDKVIAALQKHAIRKVIAIGSRIVKFISILREEGIEVEIYDSTDEFIDHFRFSTLKDEFILVKGARRFGFERIVQELEQKAHGTVMEINLSAIIHNLKEHQEHLKPGTKVMAMVKAFAYGSGGAEIAGILQFHKVDYLGVAYADEGIELRKAGIHLPIMVMNPEENTFESIVEYNLEPELYSLTMLRSFSRFLVSQGLKNYPVHLEIETGMNRLGFSEEEADELAGIIKSTGLIKVKSIFSHLVASEEPELDTFTLEQAEKFSSIAGRIQKYLDYNILIHIANSAAAIRHPELQMDMIRLGIGLYGIDNTRSDKLKLQTVTTLKSTVAQIKNIKKGESVSYNRRTIMEKDSVIATIRIGYADGYPRRLGNAKGFVVIKGKLVPVAGTVCMDMLMADITGIENVNEGDEVIIFGDQLPVTELADWAGTIPYEIMTGISQRVKRVYFQE
ncbi:MAG: alanine racemase [Chitinophagaceae bacterium]|nr:alanine racemase [Chitinophagaceae bacterium]MCB9054569.1 alanine racemase [Chitinophagales bacterium]